MKDFWGKTTENDESLRSGEFEKKRMCLDTVSAVEYSSNFILVS